MTASYRADHVGSCCARKRCWTPTRPRREARSRSDRLREIEDEAILMALEMQRQVGIDVLSDGEYRRHDWVGDFTGVGRRLRHRRAADPFRVALPDGASPAAGAGTMRRRPADAAAGRARHRRAAAAAPAPDRARGAVPEGARRRAVQGHHARPRRTSWRAAASRASPTRSTARAGSCAGRRTIMRRRGPGALLAEGVPYIQLDNAALPRLHRRDRRDAVARHRHRPRPGARRGHRRRQPAIAGPRSRAASPSPTTSAAATAAAPGTPRAATTRSPSRSSAASTSTASCSNTTPTAPAASSRCASCRRARTVVLGLVTTKVGELETQDDLLRAHRGGLEVRADREPGAQPAVRLRLGRAGQPAELGRAAAQAGAGGRDGAQGLGLTGRPT